MMQIKCMAGKGEMEHTECLACAARGDNTCGYDYAVLRFMYRTQQERPDVHVTDLTGCLLKAYWDKRVATAQYPHEKIVLALGSLTHTLLEGIDDIVSTEEHIDALGIKGTTDAYYPERGRIVDFKTTRWLKPSNLPYGSHALQVNIYAQMLRAHGWPVRSAAIQYIDLSGPTKCRKCKLPVMPAANGRLECPNCHDRPHEAHLGAVLYEVELMPEAEINALIEERRDELQLALDMNDPPAAEPSFLCGYCKHREQCPEGQRWDGREA